MQASKLLQRNHLERIRPRCLAVELDPQPRPPGREEVAVLPLRLYGDHVRQDRAGTVGLLLDAEVVAREVELQTRGRGDRAERVMQRQLDVMCLAPARDLPGFRDPAHDT